MGPKSDSDNTKNKLSRALSNTADCYKQMDQAMSKFANRYKPISDPLPDIPDIIPAFSHDSANYVGRYGMGSIKIQVVLKLDGRLDFVKLARAVRLSVDAEPVLGCRFVEANPPYFKRLEDLDSVEFCSMEEAVNTEEALHKYLERPYSLDKDLQIKVHLIRTSENDTLVVKLNHSCADGAGTKDYIDLLADIYTSLDGENGVYVPIPSERSRKDHERAFATLGIKHPELDFTTLDPPMTVWPFPWHPGKRSDVTPFVIRQLPEGQLELLSRYSKERGATINDLILTALYRAMFKTSRPPYGIPMDIGVTVDLRRYLPDNKAEAIRNFSGGVITRLPRLPGEPFEGTLSRIVPIMNHKKEKNPGYQAATAAERAEKLNFFHVLDLAKFLSRVSEISSQRCIYCSPGLSNIGIISKSCIKFGQNTVTQAYFVPPVVRPPSLLLVVSSYNGIMTFSAGYYEGSINRSHMEKLLDRIRDELMEGCR